jgi:tetratricopeptide (TPR) repeat protein
MLAVALFFSACTNMESGRRAFKNGKYRKAIRYFEKDLKRDCNNKEAQNLVILARSGLLADSAAMIMTQGRFEEGLMLVDEALGLDPQNKDAATLLNNGVVELTAKINKELIPAQNWNTIIVLTKIIVKYKPDEKGIQVAYAQAVYERERRSLNTVSIMAIKKAFQAVPDDPFLKERMVAIDAAGKPFAKAFQDYEATLVKKDFTAWKRLTHSRFIKSAEDDIKRLKEKGDPTIKNLQAYFMAISNDPVDLGSPEGAEIICVEVKSPNSAYVHFTYKKSPKIFKAEVLNTGDGWKVDREEDSELKKAEL